MTIDINNKKYKSIDTNYLLILCEIFDDYKEFYSDLEDLIKSKRKEKILFPNKKYDAFIKKHQHTIDTIKKYDYISDWTVLIYDALGRRIPDSIGVNFCFFYQYLEEHKEEIEKIKKLALKIKELGITKIAFGETLDFSTSEYYLYSSDSDFYFLENMESIPSYLNSPIKYKTNKSFYCLKLSFFKSGKNLDKIKMRNKGRKIYLNSLTFDPNRLPNEITSKSTYEVIKDLVNKKKEEHTYIKNFVDIGITTDNLKKEFEKLKEQYENFSKLKDNEELKNLLTQMQNIIFLLQLFEENYQKEVCDSNKELSIKLIKEEKDAKLKRISSIYWI